MRFGSCDGGLRRSGLALTALLISGALSADDVTGSDSLLCYALSAARCELDGPCEVKEPWDLNLPDFLKLDLKAKRAVTTEASGSLRETPLRTVERSKGTILLQGVQGERAFSTGRHGSSGGHARRSGRRVDRRNRR